MTLPACTSSIDWAATGAMLSGEGTIIGALAVLAAAWFGKTTFEAWRKQQVAARKLFQAERILEATYKARRALKYVRGRMLWAHELTAAKDKLKNDADYKTEGKGKQERLVTAQAYFNRLNRVAEDREALDQCLPMARAMFGEEVEEAIESLAHQFWLVQVNVESSIDDDGSDKEFTKQIRRGMAEIEPMDGTVNEITEAAETAVSTIEAACLPVLRA